MFIIDFNYIAPPLEELDQHMDAQVNHLVKYYDINIFIA